MSNSIDQALPSVRPAAAGRLREIVQTVRSIFKPKATPAAAEALTELGYTQLGEMPTVAVSSKSVHRKPSPTSRISPTHASAVSAVIAALALVGSGSLSFSQYQHDSYLLRRSEQAREMASAALLLASEVEEAQGRATASSRSILDDMHASLSDLSLSPGEGFLGATLPFEQEQVLMGGVLRAWDQVNKAFSELEAVSEQQAQLSDRELRLMVAGNTLVDTANAAERAELRAFANEVMKAATAGQKKVDLSALMALLNRGKVNAVAASDFAAAANTYFNTAAEIKDLGPVIGQLMHASLQLSSRLNVYAESARFERDIDAAESAPVLIAGWSMFLLAAIASVAWVGRWWRAEARREQKLAEAEFTRAEFERKRYARQEDETMEALMVFNDMADGDFTHKFEVTDTPIGTVKAAANIMIEHVRGAIAMAGSSSSALETHFAQIEHVFKFLRQVEAHQKQTAERSAGLAEQMSKGMEVLVGNATLTREAIATVNERTEIGVGAAGNTVQSMTQIRAAIQDTNKRMKKLGESIQEIMKIAEVLQRMADQSNVLAMNTALQASQTNDRRMTVLAEEVGRLSESLGQSMELIGNMGQEIGADARDTIASMERSVQHVVEGTRQIETVQHALTAIEEAAREVVGAEAQMRDILETQNEDTGNMARFATHSLSLAKYMGDAAGKLDANVAQMRASLSQLKNKLTEFTV